MKKIITLVASVILTTTTLYAQKEDKRELISISSIINQEKHKRTRDSLLLKQVITNNPNLSEEEINDRKMTVWYISKELGTKKELDIFQMIRWLHMKGPDRVKLSNKNTLIVNGEDTELKLNLKDKRLSAQSQEIWNYLYYQTRYDFKIDLMYKR